MKVYSNKLLAKRTKDYDCNHSQNRCKDEFEPECMANPFVVVLSVELGSEYSSSRKTSKDTQVIYEDKLVCYCHTRHLLRAKPSHHYVVQHTHEVREPVLDHYWNCNRQQHPVEIPVAYISLRSIVHTYHYPKERNKFKGWRKT